MYESIPSQLATNKKRYMISRATGKRKTKKDVGKDNNLNLKPIYMLPFIMEEL